MGGTLCKIGSPLLSFLLCSLCTPLQPIFQEMIKHHAIGTTRQNFPFEAFKMFPLVVPPMELQLKFEEIAKPIEQKIAKLKEENEVLAEIRDTLLPKLMSGELPAEVGEE